MVEPHALLLPAELLERAREVGRFANVDECLEAVAYLVGELSAVDIERGPIRLRNDGEGERKRRVSDVRAADVERPGDGVWIRHDQRVGALLCELGPNAGELFAGGFTGKARIVQLDCSERWGRAVGPNGVDQVGLDRDQLRADSGAGLLQPLHGLDGVQPGIVAEPVVRREILSDPAIRWHLDQMFNRKDRGIYLVAHLQGVAPVDE